MFRPKLRLIQGPILLGSLAVALGFITEEQLAEALARQANVEAGADRPLLGEILVASGDLTRAQLERLIVMQSLTALHLSDGRLGDLAVQNGFLTKPQLKEALRLQRAAPGRLLSEVLVEQRILTSSQVAALLAAQRQITGSAGRAERRIATKEVALGEGTRWTIGRASSNEVPIVDLEVAPHHARIIVREGEFFLENLDSRSGTWVDGERVQETAPLRPGAVLVFGNTVAQFLIRPDEGKGTRATSRKRSPRQTKGDTDAM